jgi:peptidoglycan glycosyltransferase
MARLCAAVANGGAAREAVLLAGEKGKETRLMEPETAEIIGQCMKYNVVYSYGKNNFPWLDLCAKTGTAELGDGTTHAWFVGYLKTGAPVAFAVLLEQGGGGLAQAGAVANHVLQLANGYYAS